MNKTVEMMLMTLVIVLLAILMGTFVALEILRQTVCLNMRVVWTGC